MILKEEIPPKSLPQVKVFILGPVDFFLAVCVLGNQEYYIYLSFNLAHKYNMKTHLQSSWSATSWQS